MSRSKKAIEQEKDLEKLLEGLNEKSDRSFRRRKRKRKPAKKSVFIISIIFNLIAWYLFFNLSSWNVPFLTKNYELILPTVKFCLSVSILGDFLLLLYFERKFKNLVRVFQGVFGLIFVFKLYTVYPFNFSYLTGSSVSDLAIKIALIAGLVGLGVSIIIELLELVLEPEKKF